MKTLIKITAGILAVSIAALVGVIAYVSLGRELGQQWSSLDGPGPVWPAVVGFGSFYVIVASAAVLIILVATFIVRENVRTRRAKTGTSG